MRKIYLLNDYLTSKKTLKNIEELLSKQYKDYEIISLDFSNYYEHTELEKIELNSVIDFFVNNLKDKINDDDILVGVGLSTRILSEFPENKKVLINPLFFNNLINVFITSKKYFENDFEQYKVYLDKLININELDINEEYFWYSKHFNKIIKLTEKINLYEVLKSLINSDNTLIKDSLILISKNNQILDSKETIKYLTKLNKKINFKFEIINTDKHLLNGTKN